ncbi:MAG: alpha/beta fold hydrolase [Bacteroidales bacterium]|nr:alpha/beta fold hydrolase [Bacteroidales bacterium]
MIKSTLYQGKSIRYQVEGEGPGLVFLHGYLESLSVWSNLIKHFISDYKVLTIDLPGHGESDVLRTVHSMKDLAQVVKYMMDFTNMPKATIIGHSMGGYIALSFVDYYPEKADGLILLHSNAYNDSTEKRIARDRDIALIRSGKKDIVINQNIPLMFASKNMPEFASVIEELKNQAKKMTDNGIVAALEGMKNRVNNANMLKHLRFPVLFIAGKLDHLIQIDISQRQVENALNVDFKVLEDSGHMGYIEQEELTVKYINSYLAKLKKI